MENYLFPFVKNIAAYSLIMGILMSMLPDGAYKKYIQLFMGFILILIVMNPIAKLTKMDMKLEQNFIWYQLELQTKEAAYNKDQIEDKAKDIYLSQYEDALGEQIEQIMEQEGFPGAKAKVKVGQDDDDYGQVKSVFVTINQEEKSDIFVDKIQVDGSVKNDEAENLTVKQLKKSLEDFYNIDSSNINIEIQG